MLSSSQNPAECFTHTEVMLTASSNCDRWRVRSTDVHMLQNQEGISMGNCL